MVSSFLAASAALLVVLGFASCTPEIGDRCQTSTDCSTRGDRLCDTSQPGGYCTQVCQGNGCPDKAACVLFDSALPGCAYDDRAGSGGSRAARPFCVAGCSSNSDCRDGFICVDPRQSPWNATILDDDKGSRTCLLKPAGWDQDAAVDVGISSAPVCQPPGAEPPQIDASPARGSDAATSLDASGIDAADASIGDGGDGGDGAASDASDASDAADADGG